MRVHILCRNWQEERIIPRQARALAERLGWSLSAAADPRADVLYLLAYFEAQRLKPWPGGPVAAYFTHREEQPAGNVKARLFDEVAGRVALRVAMCRLYAAPLEAHGPTVVPPLPVERDRFVIAPRPAHKAPVVGVSGYTYANHRKGEDLVRGVVGSKLGQRLEWRASGRGWPVPTQAYSWAEMPAFYQGLDVLLCPSRVEGGPMPVLEALSCGVRVVVPRGVGLIDELPEVAGIHRYERGDLKSLLEALEGAAFPTLPADPEALREAVAGHSVETFVMAHRRSFAEAFGAAAVPAEALDDQAGLLEQRAEISAYSVAVSCSEPVERGTGARGIYCVAFGEPAREAVARMMTSAKTHMPDVPICLCGAAPIGPEDAFVEQPDSDVGGRRAKLRAYELAPAEWQSVLYLDADTELLAPVYEYFEWVEAAWDLAICTDIQTVAAFAARASSAERLATLAVASPTSPAYNGGVWAFRRSAQVAAFFARWLVEWERWGQRDQGALLRALHAEPLRVRVLDGDWNSFPKFEPRRPAARIVHWPGAARRWDGAIRGRLDGEEAWSKVRLFEAQRAGKLADAAMRPALVRVQVGPARYVRCLPGEEEIMRQRYGEQMGRR